MARFLLFFLLVSLAPRLAFAADEADKARAKGLFAEAQALAEAGKHAEACPKFEESVKAHAGVGNRFNLADCWEKTGRLASAHALFLEVASITRELGQADREQAATARAEALAPKLTRLRLEVTAPNEGVELTRDGVVVSKADWGRAIAVDPGVHELRAAAPGKEAWTTKLDTPKEPGTIIVNVPVLADAKKPVAVVAAPAAAKAKEPVKKAPPPAEESSDGFRSAMTIGLVGVGTAGIVTGVAMSVQYKGNQQDAESICPESVGCTPEQVSKHQELVDDARTARTWALVGYGVGGLSLIGAAILHFTAPSKKDQSSAASIRPGVFASPGGTLGGTLRGEF